MAECDPLRDEGLCYLKRLGQADNKAETFDLEAIIHGFIGQTQHNLFAQAALEGLADVFSNAC